MKIIFSAVLGFCLFGVGAGEAKAGISVQETIQGTATVAGIACSSFTGTQLDSTWVAGKNRAWATVKNQDASAAVYIGFDVNVSTISLPTVNAKLGESLAAGASVTYKVGKDIKIYCRTGKDASTSPVSISQFGY